MEMLADFLELESLSFSIWSKNARTFSWKGDKSSRRKNLQQTGRNQATPTNSPFFLCILSFPPQKPPMDRFCPPDGAVPFILPTSSLRTTGPAGFG